MRQIPDDLARAQEEWHAVYLRLAARPGTALRRRLTRLSSQVLFHPYWQGRRTAARAALFAPRWGGRSRR
ncbi:hypothetical protein [Streptomyces broussonetiae]|uniref:Uncharacterized protein n=1 Tax=Streptomyces broussonetiae TaxID=2686304 RepID=A0A6I6N4M9_9ACTN|nr:hypothetical protein [Streptomyces broussonetiae]QHA07753.1 hypothetical protein GQF42_34565 [Streptomyces broussonetiae]